MNPPPSTRAPQGPLFLAPPSRRYVPMKRKLVIAIFIRLTKIFARNFFWLGFLQMRKKNLLHYELYGTSARGGKKGYWRWAIFAGREEKPLEAGSFFGTLEEAKEHAEDTISSLKQRARKH